MPFDYTTKGWPDKLMLDGDEYQVGSCGKDNNDIVYHLTNNSKNPHITIHGANKENIGKWSEQFHIRMSNSKLYEFCRDKPDDFQNTDGSPATGNGTKEQTTKAQAIAADFFKKINAKITGK